jgi:hypothetical protein
MIQRRESFLRLDATDPVCSGRVKFGSTDKIGRFVAG